jgi:hypothetical protein
MSLPQVMTPSHVSMSMHTVSPAASCSMAEHLRLHRVAVCSGSRSTTTLRWPLANCSTPPIVRETTPERPRHHLLLLPLPLLLLPPPRCCRYCCPAACCPGRNSAPTSSACACVCVNSFSLHAAPGDDFPTSWTTDASINPFYWGNQAPIGTYTCRAVAIYIYIYIYIYTNFMYNITELRTI